MSKPHGEAATVEAAREQYDEIFENAGKTESAMSPEELKEYGAQVEAAVRGSASVEEMPEAEAGNEQAQAESAEETLNTAEAGSEQPASHETAEGEGEGAPEELATEEGVEVVSTGAEAVPNDGKVHTDEQYSQEGERYDRQNARYAKWAGIATGVGSAGYLGAFAAFGIPALPVIWPIGGVIGGGYALARGVSYVRHRLQVRGYERAKGEKAYEEFQEAHRAIARRDGIVFQEENYAKINPYRKYKPKKK